MLRKATVTDDTQYIIPAGIRGTITPDYRSRKYRQWVAEEDLQLEQCRRRLSGVYLMFEVDGWLLVVREELVRRVGA